MKNRLGYFEYYANSKIHDWRGFPFYYFFFSIPAWELFCHLWNAGIEKITRTWYCHPLCKH